MTVSLALLGALMCVGCDAPGPVTVDPQADQALRAMSDALGSAETFTFHAVGVMDEVLETDQLSQFSRETNVFVRRPDRLFVDTDGDDVQRSAWYNGKTLTLLDESDKVYATIPTPAKLEQMLDFVIEEYGLTLPLADLLFRNTYESLMANVQSGAYVGRAEIGGHLCHHLAFRQEVVDWQIWIDMGVPPVPRRLVIVYKLEPGHPTFSATLDAWDLKARIPSSTFKLNLPADAEQIEMADFFSQEGGQE
jgi:hypothetical protein